MRRALEAATTAVTYFEATSSETSRFRFSVGSSLPIHMICAPRAKHVASKGHLSRGRGELTASEGISFERNEIRNRQELSRVHWAEGAKKEKIEDVQRRCKAK